MTTHRLNSKEETSPCSYTPDPIASSHRDLFRTAKPSIQINLSFSLSIYLLRVFWMLLRVTKSTIRSGANTRPSGPKRAINPTL